MHKTIETILNILFGFVIPFLVAIAIYIFAPSQLLLPILLFLMILSMWLDSRKIKNLKLELEAFKKQSKQWRKDNKVSKDIIKERIKRLEDVIKL